MHPVKRPMSARKRAAILANLAKARSAPRSPEAIARSSRNATRHGLFVRHLEGSFRTLGEDPREFVRLGGLLVQIFLPRGPTELRLVRRLAEAIWRYLRVYRAVPGWMQKELVRQLAFARNLSSLEHARKGDWGPEAVVSETELEAYKVMCALADERKFARRRSMTLCEVERTLRLLLIYRSGNPRFKFHVIGRRYLTEIADLSEDPRNWTRRYAAGAPLG
jgi:hypothetical protein